MKQIEGIGLKDVQDVYNGAEGRLWELAMGEQIHIGGLLSSMALAERAEIQSGMSGVDLCCCTGAGMRFLVRFRGVDRMIGVDATPRMVELGRSRVKDEGLANRIEFVLADACKSELPSASADFVWGEDAWCYVEDKKSLIQEAARIVKPGGIIAFTDWLEGPEKMTRAEGERFMKFMKFPNIQDISGYSGLLESADCTVITAENTQRFAEYTDLYINMLTKQLTYDSLKIIGFDTTLMEQLGGEMYFMRDLAHSGKIEQAMLIARKK